MLEENTSNPSPTADPALEVIEADFTDEGLDSALLEAVSVQAEQLDGRQRQICATIQIPRPLEQVWKVLTDYEALSDFIPNLARSERVAHPAGGVRIEQVGTQKLMRFNFSARVVLDMEEEFPKAIRFNMVEGDFKAFSGYWQLEPCPGTDPPETRLCYVVRIWPKRLMPISLIENRLTKDMSVNLWAIRKRVCELFGHHK